MHRATEARQEVNELEIKIANGEEVGGYHALPITIFICKEGRDFVRNMSTINVSHCSLEPRVSLLDQWMDWSVRSWHFNPLVV